MNTTVKVENLKIYAFHGCMDEEKIIGSDYLVKIKAECVLGKKAFLFRILLCSIFILFLSITFKWFLYLL